MYSRPLSLRSMKINDKFWKQEMEVVRKEVIPYQWAALNDQVEGAAPSFCMRNFKVAGKQNKERKEQGKAFIEPKYTFRGFESLPEDPNHPEDKFYGFVFQDSDFSKWIEAVGYSLTQHPDPKLEAIADGAIDIVCAAQQDDGYLDTYYIINGKDKIFTNLKDHHELYCMGHLIEGAVAYYEATGKDKLLKAAARFADYAAAHFGPEEGKCKGYPGHEIAEMALVRLYEVTKEPKYLELSKFFIDERGKRPYYFDKEHPEEIIAARKSSPLVVGIGEDEFFLASDATPIVEYTDKVVYLEDGEIAVINRGKELKVVDLSNVEMTPEVKKVELKLGQLEKGGYPHFMLKEIFEQPDCIHDCMRGRINVEANNVVLSAVIDYKEKLLNAKRFIIVACGTSWHAGLIGKHLIESFCRIPVEVEYASEFRYRDPVIDEHDVVIAISQSGETADTLAAVELAKSRGAFIYGICNAIGSSIPRATHTGSYIHVGPEIGVASTKAFTGQVTVLTMLALTLAREKGTIDETQYLNIVRELNSIPGKMKEVLKLNDKLAELSKTFTYAHNFIYLGRGYSYPVALEGALKLKEISYIHAEGYPAAEMKHGPIALIDAEMPVVVIATQNGLYEKVLSNIQEIKARKGKVIAFVTKGDTVISKIADCSIELPETIECLDPLITTVPLQLLAYHIAVCKGMDVDQPRNLAKSVTVE
mgnify:CR=1 FL=1